MIKDSVYVVTREGVYRHEIMGIFANPSDAERCALRCLKEEIDDYHRFWILRLPLNKDIPLGKLKEDERWETPYMDWDYDNRSALQAIHYRLGNLFHKEIPERKD